MSVDEHKVECRKINCDNVPRNTIHGYCDIHVDRIVKCMVYRCHNLPRKTRNHGYCGIHVKTELCQICYKDYYKGSEDDYGSVWRHYCNCHP